MPLKKYKNITESGQKLSSGLNVYDRVQVVTDVKRRFARNVKIVFTGETLSDHVSNISLPSQFSVDTGALLGDGSSHNNNFVVRYAQFIAFVNCKLVNVFGYMSASGGGSEGEEQTFTLSVWKKSVVINDDATTTSAINILYQKTFAVNATQTIITKIDTTSTTAFNNTTQINQDEGVFCSIKRNDEDANLNVNANFELVFEEINPNFVVDDEFVGNGIEKGDLLIPQVKTQKGRFVEVLSEKQ